MATVIPIGKVVNWYRSIDRSALIESCTYAVRCPTMDHSSHLSLTTVQLQTGSLLCATVRQRAVLYVLGTPEYCAAAAVELSVVTLRGDETGLELIGKLTQSIGRGGVDLNRDHGCV